MQLNRCRERESAATWCFMSVYVASNSLDQQWPTSLVAQTWPVDLCVILLVGLPTSPNVC